MSKKTNNKPFTSEMFSPSEFLTSEDKSKFLNSLVKFTLGGFNENCFSNKLYNRLSSIFGHIAHYNKKGFYETWFSRPEQIRSWVNHVREYNCVGPDSDIGKNFQHWMNSHMDDLTKIILLMETEAFNMACQSGSQVRFKVIAQSANRGAFGHIRYILVGENKISIALDIQPPQNNPYNEPVSLGDIYTFIVNQIGVPIDYKTSKAETMTTLPQAPESVFEEAWGNDKVLT